MANKPFGIQVCIGLFIGLSVISVTGRLGIRIRGGHRLQLDDAFLLFGLACMCVAAGLIYSTVSLIFLEEAATLYQKAYPIPWNKLPYGVDVAIALTIIQWTAEASVKISLLLFFKVLVRRLKHLSRYVNSLLILTSLLWAFFISSPVIICPHHGLSSLSRCS